ncbi:MAG: hypothetical protein AAF234_15970 [Pseudomonadota bacterium]
MNGAVQGLDWSDMIQRVCAHQDHAVVRRLMQAAEDGIVQGVADRQSRSAAQPATWH